MATNIEVRVKFMFMEEALRLATSVGVSITCMYVACIVYQWSLLFMAMQGIRYVPVLCSMLCSVIPFHMAYVSKVPS